MSPRMPTPTDLGSVTAETFHVTWSDGHRSRYTWRRLRMSCPCAACRGEWRSPRPKLREEDIPEGIRALRIERVGAYALRPVWSDGHHTGIYTFASLRHDLCECEECARGRSGSDPESDESVTPVT